MLSRRFASAQRTASVIRNQLFKGERGKSLHYEDKEDVWIIKREYWTGDQKTPTKLPSELIRKILMYSSEKGNIVLDPFLGSGQVDVVSKMLNRQYIGFEIVKEYYEFAKERLEKNLYIIRKEYEITKQPLLKLFDKGVKYGETGMKKSDISAAIARVRSQMQPSARGDGWSIIRSRVRDVKTPD